MKKKTKKVVKHTKHAATAHKDHQVRTALGFLALLVVFSVFVIIMTNKDDIVERDATWIVALLAIFVGGLVMVLWYRLTQPKR